MRVFRKPSCLEPIEAFRIHAVQTGRIDHELASSLSRTENLRLKADYTGAEIDVGVAEEVVAHAEKFVRTVEQVFGLEGRLKDADASRPSTEEMRRQAAENWRRNYYDKRNEIPGPEQESTDAEQDITEIDVRHQRDTGMDFDPER